MCLQRWRMHLQHLAWWRLNQLGQVSVWVLPWLYMRRPFPFYSLLHANIRWGKFIIDLKQQLRSRNIHHNSQFQFCYLRKSQKYKSEDVPMSKFWVEPTWSILTGSCLHRAPSHCWHHARLGSKLGSQTLTRRKSSGLAHQLLSLQRGAETKSWGF